MDHLTLLLILSKGNGVQDSKLKEYEEWDLSREYQMIEHQMSTIINSGKTKEQIAGDEGVSNYYTLAIGRKKRGRYWKKLWICNAFNRNLHNTVRI